MRRCTIGVSGLPVARRVCARALGFVLPGVRAGRFIEMHKLFHVTQSVREGARTAQFIEMHKLFYVTESVREGARATLCVEMHKHLYRTHRPRGWHAQQAYHALYVG